MIGSMDLVLATLERALTVTVLPATSASDADARQEVSLGALFSRWLRDVVDHVADAERLSRRDLREALGEVVEATVKHSPRGASAEALREARTFLAGSPADESAAVREEIRRAKTLLARALRAARADGDADLAAAIRSILARIAAREIERELAFTRATGMDPDAATVTPLADLVRRAQEPRKEPA